MFERVFKLSENKTNVKTEVMAGITTFMTMAYILAVNPSILGSTGMDTTAVLLATALASFIGTACMGLMANLPFALSAGMGLNAFMAYTVVAGDGTGALTMCDFDESCSPGVLLPAKQSESRYLCANALCQSRAPPVTCLSSMQ